MAKDGSLDIYFLLAQKNTCCGSSLTLTIAIWISGVWVVSYRQPACSYLLTHLGCMIKTGFSPAIFSSISLTSLRDRSFPPTHRMSMRAAIEISVTAENSCYHTHSELKSFGHTTPETFGAVQRKKHVTAAVERQQLIPRQALGNQDNSGVFRSTGLQPLPFGTETPGQKCLISRATCSDSGWLVHSRPNVAGRCGRGKAC